MFLTKKSFRKILIMAITYIAVGSISIATGILFTRLQANATLFFVLGAFLYLACPLIVLWGRYAEGKGIFINLGNTLVRNELKPTEFIKQYEALKSSTDLVIKSPDIEVLHLLAVAYDSLGDKKNCLSTADEMIAIAREKKKAYAKLIKVSFLYSFGMTEEAETLFTEVRSGKMNLVCQGFADSLMKSDRAMAIGDYQTVEISNLKRLEQTFPRLDNLSRLVLHFSLGEVYEKQKEPEKAIPYYQYCVDYGGETAIKKDAANALKRLS